MKNRFLACCRHRRSGESSALLILCFGLATLPAKVVTTWGATSLQCWLRRAYTQRVLRTLLIASGVWAIYMTASHGDHSINSQHHGKR